MMACARISDGLPAVLSAVLSAVGPAKAEGPAKTRRSCRVAAAAISAAAQHRRPTNALFPPVLTIFRENQPNQHKCLSVNYLRTKRCFPNQTQSRLIKANQGIFQP
jgi:hypothetical protein